MLLSRFHLGSSLLITVMTAWRDELSITREVLVDMLMRNCKMATLGSAGVELWLAGWCYLGTGLYTRLLLCWSSLGAKAGLVVLRKMLL
jgi:hypothetical protein